MLRDILAGVAGVAIAVAIVFLADELSHMLNPVPPAAPLIVMGGWVLATFVGAVVATRIGTAKPWIFPTVVGILMFAATAATLIAIPHPLWFSIASLIAILASAWLAWKAAPQV